MLKILYAKQLELASIDSINSAYTAARFGHKYDSPFLLKSADAYLSAHVFTDDRRPQVRAARKTCPSFMNCTHVLDEACILTVLEERLQATQPGPGAAAKGACVYERALMWALEAEKLDLPRLSAQCERFIAMHYEHLHKYALRIASLSSPARHCIMMGMFHALQSAQKCTVKCQPCNKFYFNTYGKLKPCQDCAGTGHRVLITHSTVEDFMSWRTTPGGAS